MLRAIRTTVTSPATVRRVVVFLMMTLLFGLQSVAISAANSNDISHSFSAVEHQDTAGISTHHEGCSAKNSSVPLDLPESVPLVGSYSAQPDLPVYYWAATLTFDFAVSALLAVTQFSPPSPETAPYSTPVFRQDVLLI